MIESSGGACGPLSESNDMKRFPDQFEFSNYYAAKKERDSLEKPTNWIITIERGKYRLVQVS